MTDQEMQKVKPTSQNSIRRASDAAPTGQHCLVENCPTERAVEVAHVLGRDWSGKPRVMTAIEWNWNMRKSTLNLDTHRNLMFLGASLHALYKKKEWALVPSEDTINRYFYDPEGLFNVVVDRESFPSFSETVFRYTLLPLSNDMSTCPITRHSTHPKVDGKAMLTTYHFPFEAFPKIDSHVHPNFVTLHLASILREKNEDPYVQHLLNVNPLLVKISYIHFQWCCTTLHISSRTDLTFVKKARRDLSDGGSWGSQSDSDRSASDSSQSTAFDSGSVGDSVCTPPFRIRYPGSPGFEPLPIETRDAEGEKGSPGVVKSSKSGWEREDILKWVLGCSF